MVAQTPNGSADEGGDVPILECGPERIESDMKQSIILGIGTGRCGSRSLAEVLNQQPDVRVTHELLPLLPWHAGDARRVIACRFARFRRERSAPIVGDVASFYLPYLEDAFALELDLRVICLERPCEEVVRSFCNWLDHVHPLPTNHWARSPADGWYHEPIWTRIFPHYETQEREAGIRRYWNEYKTRIAALAQQFPDNVRVFPTADVLNSEAHQREMLAFVGIPHDQQVLVLGTHVHGSPQPVSEQPGRAPGGDPLDPRRCVVLVPFSGQIHPRCEHGLVELERRGYTVWRVPGYAAIDQGRNQLATDALVAGFEETMWIDADIAFSADAVDTLRRHQLPIVCGIYPKKGKREVACHVLPGTSQIVFGRHGGLLELRYCATGFLLVHRRVYERIQMKLQLPVCNEQFGKPTIPFFQPTAHPEEDGYWYLAEDYAFSQRASQCGFKIMADTRIRLWHMGEYGYSWEDAGNAPRRYTTFTLRLAPDEGERSAHSLSNRT